MARLRELEEAERSYLQYNGWMRRKVRDELRWTKAPHYDVTTEMALRAQKLKDYELRKKATS